MPIEVGPKEPLVSEGYFRKKDYESALCPPPRGGWGEIEVAYRIGGTTGWDCDWVEKGALAHSSLFMMHPNPAPTIMGIHPSAIHEMNASLSATTAT